MPADQVAALAESTVPPADPDPGYTLYTGDWPLLFIVEHRPLTPQEAAKQLDAVEESLWHKEGLALIVESLHQEPREPETRGVHLEWHRHNRELMRRRCACMGVITNRSFLSRGSAAALMAVFASPPVPFRIFLKREAALDWAANVGAR